LFLIPEQQPGARYLNVRTADECAMIKWKLSNKRKAGEAHVDCRLHKGCNCVIFPLELELLAISVTIIVIISKNTDSYEGNPAVGPAQTRIMEKEGCASVPSPC
jgi:hypothetical protein